MSIYKPCDIRGSANEQLTPELYRRWGQILGRRVNPQEKFVVGGDTRGSTPGFLAALVDGLCDADVDVVELGQMPTPMIYYAHRRLLSAGCAIVTASHNPAEINGLKWAIGQNPPTPEEVEHLRAKTKAGEESLEKRKRSQARSLDVTFDYVAWLQERWVDGLDAHMHVVVDPMYGGWANRVRRYLHAIFPQCIFSTIHDTTEDDFGGQMPDCSRPDYLHALTDAVYHQRADLGLAFDGDGDRVALVDETGIALTAEETTGVLLQTFNKELSDRPFVYDLKFSDCVREMAMQHGAMPQVERSGHAFIRTRMRREQALFGAEISGHYFYGELDGADDGLYTACRIIAFLAQADVSLGELRRRCPRVYMTPDLRVSVAPAKQAAIVEQVSAAWKDFPQQVIDGVRIDTPAGWALMRPSVTEPALTFRFESIDWPALDELVRRFCDQLPELGDELWTQYETALGSRE